MNATTPTPPETKRKRISVYNAKITMQFEVGDDAQAAIEARKKIEALAKELGARDIEGHGTFGSTMIDVPK